MVIRFALPKRTGSPEESIGFICGVALKAMHDFRKRTEVVGRLVREESVGCDWAFADAGRVHHVAVSNY